MRLYREEETCIILALPFFIRSFAFNFYDFSCFCVFVIDFHGQLLSGILSLFKNRGHLVSKSLLKTWSVFKLRGAQKSGSYDFAGFFVCLCQFCKIRSFFIKLFEPCKKKFFFPLLKIASTTFSLGLAEIESFPSRSQGLFNFSLER